MGGLKATTFIKECEKKKVSLCTDTCWTLIFSWKTSRLLKFASSWGKRQNGMTQTLFDFSIKQNQRSPLFHLRNKMGRLLNDDSFSVSVCKALGCIDPRWGVKLKISLMNVHNIIVAWAAALMPESLFSSCFVICRPSPQGYPHCKQHLAFWYEPEAPYRSFGASCVIFSAGK